MPIIPQQKTDLSFKERQKLRALIREAESRGLPVAEILRKKFVKQSRIWETDSNGWFPRRDGRLFTPYENQEKFILSNARFSLLISGRGGGKTASGAQKALQKIKLGLSGSILNPTFENFKNSTWPEFREWIPWKYVVPAHKYRANDSFDPSRPFKIVFENGAVAYLRGLKDPSSARGANLNWLWLDEAQDDDDGMAWKIAIPSVRIGENPQAWATATGRGTLHWLYEFFVEQRFDDEDEELLDNIQNKVENEVTLVDWYRGTIGDNKGNLDPGFYESMLKAYPVGYLRDQELRGEFVNPGQSLGDERWFDGRILPNPPENVIKRVRYWDLAATEKKILKKKITDPDETAGTLLSHFIDETLPYNYRDQFCIEDQVSGTWKWDKIKVNIRDAAIKDGVFVPVYVEQEPASGED